MFARQNWLAWTVLGLVLSVPPLRADEAGDGDNWVETMKAVHTRFTGQRGTIAQFGDSITVSQAYWAPLRYNVQGLSPDGTAALRRVAAHMHNECWAKWKGNEFGSEGSKTIRWAQENVDDWLEQLNPEVAVIMFGTNDIGQLELDEYTETVLAVLQRCLDNGTVVILSTIPPRSGMLDESRRFAEAVAQIAREERVPLVNYFDEILRRRPDDWDGTLPEFRGVPGDEYQVPTFISRDGVHPSFPREFASDFSETGLSKNGYGLRSYLTLLAYRDTIEKVLDPIESDHRGSVHAVTGRPARFPHRIWAACDFEAATPDYAWFGKAETEHVPNYPGNRTALRADAAPSGSLSALKSGMNPVPGPMMGRVNKLYLRYFLQGAPEVVFQHYSLTTNDNCHIRAAGLRQDAWSETTLNFTRDAIRNDGTPGVPFQEGERMDDFQLYIGQANDGREYEALIDDVIFFAEDAVAPLEDEPFPNRVIFLAAFDTGIDAASRPKYWPGDFDIVCKEQAPADSYWNVARAVPRGDRAGKWLRLQISPSRPVGEHTKLRFRYHLTGASEMTVQIFDATDQDNRHVRLQALPQGGWQTRYVDLTADGRRNDGGTTPFAAGHLVDDLFFFVSSESDADVELFVDEVVLFDAGRPLDWTVSGTAEMPGVHDGGK